MSYEVRVERADPRPLAAIGTTTTHQRLGADIVRLLDMIWPVLREQNVRTGHNVVVYPVFRTSRRRFLPIYGVLA
jgi:hypothetical protein